MRFVLRVHCVGCVCCRLVSLVSLVSRVSRVSCLTQHVDRDRVALAQQFDAPRALAVRGGAHVRRVRAGVACQQQDPLWGSLDYCIDYEVL